MIRLVDKMRLFGEKKKDPKELLRENQRTLKKSEREMDREAMTMKREEQKLILEIKKASKVISGVNHAKDTLHEHIISDLLTS